MKKWKQKAIVQKAISYLPYPKRINFLFQKYVTRGVHLSDDYFYDRLEHAKNHIAAFQRSSSLTVPATSLELGTGWYPIVPVSMFLLGAEKVHSVDISLLISKKRLLQTLRRFAEAEKNDMLQSYIACQPGRMQVIHEILNNAGQLTFDQMLSRLRISYLLEDARDMSLDDQSIDLIHSNNTFEHIYPEVLRGILAEFKRVVSKPGGVMSHFVDMTDHFAHFDRSISVYHFLQYTDKQWRLIDNSIQPQNRLRADDYLRLYAETEIPVSNHECRPGDIDELLTVALAGKYRNKRAADLAKTHCHYISVL